MTHAVLFKTHFWDDFVERRFNDLRARCAGVDLWIAVDETHGDICSIPYDKVFRSREADMLALGFPKQPGVSLNWHNGDYQLLAFHEAHRDLQYNFYVWVEYDAVFNFELAHFCSEAVRRGIDLVSQPTLVGIDDWNGTYTIEGLWPKEQLDHQLLCIAGFSRRALDYLYGVRRNHASLFKDGLIQNWPLGEGVIPTSLKAGGFVVDALSSFGSTSDYDWWPPYHENELEQLLNISTPSFIHPVLTGERYVKSLVRITRHRYFDGLLDPRSLIRVKLALENQSIVLPYIIDALRNESFQDICYSSVSIMAIHPEWEGHFIINNESGRINHYNSGRYGQFFLEGKKLIVHWDDKIVEEFIKIGNIYVFNLSESQT